MSSVHYTHIKRSPKSRCAICSGFEDTAKMSPRSRGTCPPDLAGDLLQFNSMIIHNPHAWRTQKSDVYGSTHIGVINSVLNSVKIIASGRIQVEPRQMPVCMKLGSSVYIEALVSMIELRKQIYTGGSRRLTKCI